MRPKLRIRLFVSLGLLLIQARTYAAEADALAISVNIQARHLPFGTILDPILPSATSDQIVGYTRCGDSAIWTGHYLAAEAFRYQVTRSTQALENVRRAIAGIKTLIDVTGTDLLARCAVPAGSPFAVSIQNEEAQNGIHTAGPLVWVGRTSRDQYSGVMFGLGVAYDLVDDAELQDSIRRLVTRLIDFLIAHAWSVVMPDGSVSTTFFGRVDQILSFLQVARHVNPERFSAAYDRQSVGAAILLPILFDNLSDSSYFKFNLNHIDLYNLIRLDSQTGRTAARTAYGLLRDHTESHQNAFFQVIDRAIRGPDAARDAQTLALLDSWLQRSRRDMRVNLHGTVRVCGDRTCQPVAVALRPPTDFLWQRDPYQLAGGGDGRVESTGIDYILPYWMTRYYALASEFAVQSAAAARATLAAGSIGSLYGFNLAAVTDQATAQPLPESLAGIGVMVRDVEGSTRPAALIYVSPNQINFVVPPSTAPGLATFIVTSAGAERARIPGTVVGVSPALFSAAGTGTGVAAATAIRAEEGKQTLVSVFRCGANGCAGTSIDLNQRSTVYLSLFGTGIRNARSRTDVAVTINGLSVPAHYAGPQPEFAGLDQVNVELPASLRGAGEANIVLTIGTQATNTVTVNLR